ncbi:MAG: hypothetical protein AB1589_00510 [Cyanobacteriota bacterium]
MTDNEQRFPPPLSKGYNHIGKQKLKSIGVHHNHSYRPGGDRTFMQVTTRFNFRSDRLMSRFDSESSLT